MSFVPLSDDAVEALKQERALRRRTEAADSAVAIAYARERMAAWVARRIDEGEPASSQALHRALEGRAQATRSLTRARGARRLLLHRLARIRSNWQGTH